MLFFPIRRFSFFSICINILTNPESKKEEEKNKMKCPAINLFYEYRLLSIHRIRHFFIFISFWRILVFSCSGTITMDQHHVKSVLYNLCKEEIKKKRIIICLYSLRFKTFKLPKKVILNLILFSNLKRRIFFLLWSR